MSTSILGLSAFYHDSAACLVRDGQIVAAAQEERFSRQKHDAGFPRGAVAYCLREAGLASAGEVDYVVFYDKPIVKFQRLLETYLQFAPRGLRSYLEAMPLWLKSKIKLRDVIRKELDYEGTILFTEHHESHAASAFLPSPFARAAVLTVDGVGERATATVGFGEGNRVQILKELHFPHSLGLLYSAFTYFTGFRVNSGEYKLMGLAPFGEPRYVDLILGELIDLREDGSLRLNMDYFDYCTGLRMTNERFARLFGGPPRAATAVLTRREMDLARSVQEVTERTMLAMARFAHRITGARQLVLAGGVALNCVANTTILRQAPFDDLWIQPAAGDAGGALGAALFVHHQLLGAPRTADGERDAQRASLLGPGFDDAEIGRFLAAEGIAATRLERREELVARVAGLLADGKVVGWFQGRMEFGPRALGARSILADPRRPEMRDTLNLRVKFRESFRPFAPAVLSERTADYFELDRASPYMLLVSSLHPSRRLAVDDNASAGLDRLLPIRSTLPAVTHVDGTARVQTVARQDHPLFHALIERFAETTGCPVVLNTSFNVRGEPIVCSPAEAYRCFQRTAIDALVLGSWVIDKHGDSERAVAWGRPPEAAAVAAAETTADDRSERREARRFALVLVTLLAALATVSLALSHPDRALLLLGLGALVAATAALAPAVWRIVFRAWMRAALALGRLLSTTVLGLVFYLVLTPVALMLRLAGRRPIDTDWSDRRASYWGDRAPVTSSLERYERQF